MALRIYHLNAQNLSAESRKILFDKIDNFSFMSFRDPKNINCLEVYWDSNEDLKKSMGIPNECIITPL